MRQWSTQARLPELLRGLRPSETVCVADMTGTLLYQSPDGSGYPDPARLLHRAYLAQGGALVVVTGDSLPVVREQFLAPLGFEGGDLFLITCAGHRIDAVRRAWGRPRLRCLHRGRDVPPQTRDELLRRIITCLEAEVGKPTSQWLDAATPRLLTSRGNRLDIASRYPRLGGPCRIEVVPSKVTCFFPARVQAEGIQARVLDRIAADSRLGRLARREGMQVIRGPNFVDVIFGDKASGLDTFARLPQASRLRTAERTLIVLGDSVNDHPMYAHTGIPCRRRILVYLGADDRPAVPDSADTHFIHLAEQNVAGSTLVFELLGATRVPGGSR
jgi:hypothetical protein